MFASASADNIKEWMCPTGKFVTNCSGHNAIVNTLACNSDGVLVSGGEYSSFHLLLTILTVHAHFLCVGQDFILSFYL